MAFATGAKRLAGRDRHPRLFDDGIYLVVREAQPTHIQPSKIGGVRVKNRDLRQRTLERAVQKGVIAFNISHQGMTP